MRITFLGIAEEQMGLGLMAAIARKEGHQIDLAFSSSLFDDNKRLAWTSVARVFDDTPEVMAQIERQRPDVIAASPLTCNYKWAVKIARLAKEMFPGVKVVFGGIHVTALPDRAIQRPEIDYVVAGEGEIAFPLILKAIAAGGSSKPIPNTRFKTPDGVVIRGVQEGFIENLDDIPFGEKIMWERHVDIGAPYHAMAARGCPYRCTFCFNSFVAKLPEKKGGKYVRMRSPGHMMAELRWVKKRYQIQYLEFHDDVFTTNKAWVKAFLDMYRDEIRIPFQIQTHPRYMDDEMARWLYEAGCTWVQLGIQSADEDFRNETLKRYEKQDHVERALEAMNRAGLKIKCDHIFGLPGEPIGAQDKALALYKRHRPYRVNAHWLTYFPGNEMTQQAIQRGDLAPDQIEKIYEGEGSFSIQDGGKTYDEEAHKTFIAHNLIFRLIPVAPDKVRNELSPKRLMSLPMPVLQQAAFVSDIVVGLMEKNPNHRAYIEYYVQNLTRFAVTRTGADRLGVPWPSASRVIDPDALAPESPPPEDQVLAA
ncbi:MAG: hypothetical protein GMKNLPBB_01124 [Myxococcota bacterium]|nr:hypothetical protein [Myxococcota bacterium]